MSKVVAPAGSTAAKVIAAIKAEVGYKESFSGGHWTNHEKFAAQVPGMAWVSTSGSPWCAVFASWGFIQGGLKTNQFALTASCDIGGSWYKSAKRWSEYPAVGAQVFFGTSSDLSHTGIVVAYDDTTVWTVEGNTNDSGSREGDGVYAKSYSRTSSRIIGYGYPLYPEGIQSADPAWKAKAPKPSAPKPTTPPKVPAKTPRVTAVLDAKGSTELRAALTALKGSGSKEGQALAASYLQHLDAIKALRVSLRKIEKK